MVSCLHCRGKTRLTSNKYCSNQCQADYQYSTFIKLWSLGKVTGSRGINVRAISQHLRRFLVEKYGDQCSECGWKQKHPTTGRTPLEIDHIDGNSENNKEENLRLICPNCHSLTVNFRNLNKGNGRGWRLANNKHSPSLIAKSEVI